MTDKEAANFVRVARASLDMTQEQFASLLGVSTKTIKRYESEHDAVPETVRLSLVTILGLAERLKPQQ